MALLSALHWVKRNILCCICNEIDDEPPCVSSNTTTTIITSVDVSSQTASHNEVKLAHTVDSTHAIDASRSRGSSQHKCAHAHSHTSASTSSPSPSLRSLHAMQPVSADALDIPALPDTPLRDLERDFLIIKDLHGKGIFKLAAHKKTRTTHILKFYSDIDRARQLFALNKFVTHPNIVEMLDYGRFGKRVCDSVILDSSSNVNSRGGVGARAGDHACDNVAVAVFEWLSGGDMFDYVHANGALAERTARHVFSQVVDAVRHLHSFGIAHRDLKLENVCIHNDTVKIIDLDYAAHRSEKIDSFPGAPEYVAPEVFAFRQYDLRAADVWALGVILYALVMGSLPFKFGRRNNLHEIRCTLRHGVDLEKVNVSPHLRDLLRRMLDQQPSKRISIHGVHDHAWLSQS